MQNVIKKMIILFLAGYMLLMFTDILNTAQYFADNTPQSCINESVNNLCSCEEDSNRANCCCSIEFDSTTSSAEYCCAYKKAACCTIPEINIDYPLFKFIVYNGGINNLHTSSISYFSTASFYQNRFSKTIYHPPC